MKKVQIKKKQMKITHLKKQGNKNTHQLETNSIGRKNLRIQDQVRGRKHYLSQDQIHWLQAPT